MSRGLKEMEFPNFCQNWLHPWSSKQSPRREQAHTTRDFCVYLRVQISRDRPDWGSSEPTAEPPLGGLADPLKTGETSGLHSQIHQTPEHSVLTIRSSEYGVSKAKSPQVFNPAIWKYIKTLLRPPSYSCFTRHSSFQTSSSLLSLREIIFHHGASTQD